MITCASTTAPTVKGTWTSDFESHAPRGELSVRARRRPTPTTEGGKTIGTSRSMSTAPRDALPREIAQASGVPNNTQTSIAAAVVIRLRDIASITTLWLKGPGPCSDPVSARKSPARGSNNAIPSGIPAAKIRALCRVESLIWVEIPGP